MVNGRGHIQITIFFIKMETGSSKKAKRYNWESRSPTDCITDLECLVRAIRIALKEKYNIAVSRSVESLSKIFDIEIAMTFIAKYHLDDAH